MTALISYPHMDISMDISMDIFMDIHIHGKPADGSCGCSAVNKIFIHSYHRLLLYADKTANLISHMLLYTNQKT